MADRRSGHVLGIVGGMGPLASTEFLQTIYDYGIGEREQDSPVVILYSDPTFPDRTEAFLAGEFDTILGRLIDVLNRLREMGASKFVICCMTIHYLLPKLPPHLRQQILSPLDVIFTNIVKNSKRHLLLCSTGTRELGLFQEHSRWESSKDLFVLPTPDDQAIIHRDIIYPVKRKYDINRLIPAVESLLAKYEVDSFVVGCSEVHMIAKQFVQTRGDAGRVGVLDPFSIIAKQIAQGQICNT